MRALRKKLFGKLAVIIALGITAMSFTGCAKSPANAAGNDNSAPRQENKGNTVDRISFEKVTEEQMPDVLKAKVQKYKEQRGFLYVEKDGYYYVAIFSGVRPTGGYGIEVKVVEDSEGKTVILVEETAPKPDDFVTQALTYPYTVIRLKGVTNNFVVENTAGQRFEMIKQ